MAVSQPQALMFGFNTAGRHAPARVLAVSIRSNQFDARAQALSHSARFQYERLGNPDLAQSRLCL